MILTTFDPGFDVTGYAIFDLPGPPRTLQGILEHLLHAGEIKTLPTDSDAIRLHQIGRAVHDLLVSHPPDIIGIEMPAYIGDYGNQRQRRASVNKLYMAIGAILARTVGERVIQLRALTTPKAQRHELLESAARIGGIELPKGPRGGTRDDAWDAIFLGCQLVMDQGHSLFAPSHRFSDNPVRKAAS